VTLGHYNPVILFLVLPLSVEMQNRRLKSNVSMVELYFDVLFVFMEVIELEL
jgi:hypothetical protein